MEKTTILYHGSCPDGFGGAYAAWKKFGDAAEYIELSRSGELPIAACTDADVYLIDFTYNSKEDMNRIAAIARSFTVLDHHEGVKEITQSAERHVYDAERSGAGIAWDYFHPNVSRPKLIEYLEDDDLFKFTFSETRPVLAYLGLHPFTFEFWDETMRTLEKANEAEELLTTARAYGACFEKLAELSVEKAKLVTFEGYVCGFATAHPYKPIKSLVGNLLARKHPPIALVVTAHPEGYGVSIRGDGSVDVSRIAQKYGGNGHPNASGFLIPREGPFPWTMVEEEHKE